MDQQPPINIPALQDPIKSDPGEQDPAKGQEPGGHVQQGEPGEKKDPSEPPGDDEKPAIVEVEPILEKEGHFSYNGSLYRVKFPRYNIPGIGQRTRAEICVDEPSQKYLVEKCVGTSIELVTE